MAVTCFSLDFFSGTKESKIEMTPVKSTKYSAESWGLKDTFPFIESV